jgi:hypothetical protein
MTLIGARGFGIIVLLALARAWCARSPSNALCFHSQVVDVHYTAAKRR